MNMRKERGDVQAMAQFVTLGIFILIGVIVYANIFAAAALSSVTGESLNTSITSNISLTTTNTPLYASPAPVVYAGGSVITGSGNYTWNSYEIGNITIVNNSDTYLQAITVDYTYSSTRDATAKATIDSLNKTWYSSVELLVLVFLVIAAVVILAYVSRLGGRGQ